WSRGKSHHDVVVATMPPWWHGIEVSSVEGIEDFVQDAVLAVLLVIVDDKIDGDTRDLVLAGFDAAAFVGIDDVGDRFLLLQRKSVGCRFFAKFLDRFPNHFHRGIMVARCYGITTGIMVSWYRGITVAWCPGFF